MQQPSGQGNNPARRCIAIWRGELWFPKLGAQEIRVRLRPIGNALNCMRLRSWPSIFDSPCVLRTVPLRPWSLFPPPLPPDAMAVDVYTYTHTHTHKYLYTPGRRIVARHLIFHHDR